MKKFLLLPVIGLIVMISASGVYTFQKEYRLISFHILSNNGQPFGLKDVYDEYVSIKPQVDGLSYLGNTSAPISIVIYLDMSKQASRDFITQTLPELDHDYLQQGKARIYMKSALTYEDYIAKDDTYNSAISMICLSTLGKERYFSSIRSIANLGLNEKAQWLDSLNLSKQESDKFNTCLESSDDTVIKGQILETERMGISGYSPVLSVGIDNGYSESYGIDEYRNLKRIIKNYQREVGD